MPDVGDSSTLAYAVTEAHTQKALCQNNDRARSSGIKMKNEKRKYSASISKTGTSDEPTLENATVVRTERK
jgi:NCAIR mutase (PurE)-related protein